MLVTPRARSCAAVSIGEAPSILRWQRPNTSTASGTHHAACLCEGDDEDFSSFFLMGARKEPASTQVIDGNYDFNTHC